MRNSGRSQVGVSLLLVDRSRGHSVVCWQMADLEEARQLHLHAQCPGGVAGRCTQLECPQTTGTYTWWSLTDCMAADSTHGDHFKKKEVEAKVF